MTRLRTEKDFLIDKLLMKALTDGCLIKQKRRSLQSRMSLPGLFARPEELSMPPLPLSMRPGKLILELPPEERDLAKQFTGEDFSRYRPETIARMLAEIQLLRSF